MEKNIYTKLLEFQKKNVSVVKGSVNPHFKNRYANLNEVLEKVKGPLNELGIVIVQRPETRNSQTGEIFGLLTVLMDTESKTSTDSFTPFINTTDMQKLGGAITYARRYSLITMLGLEDEDDDGNKAAGNTKEEETPLPTIRR